MPHYVISQSGALFSPQESPLDIFSPLPLGEGKYNAKVRYEPGNRIRITCFSRPIFNPDGLEPIRFPYTGQVDPRPQIWNPFTDRVEYVSKFYDPQARREDSIKRAIDKAFEIGLSNDFRYFITLTLSREKIDRYNLAEIYPKLKNWLSNRVSRNQMDYLLFPEYHKQKKGETRPAVHFHLLANAEGLQLADSGKRTQSGQPIYNLPGWKYGFSTCIELDGRPAIVRYVTKYIIKGNQTILGKSYLSGGKTLKRSLPCEYLNCEYEEFEGREYHIPDAHMSVKYRTYDLDMPEQEDEWFE